MNFDEDFLKSVGLESMPPYQKPAFLDYITEKIEIKIGEKITSGMSDEQISEFEACKTDEESLAWLDKNRPNFREIIDSVIEDTKSLIRKNRDKFLISA